MWNRKKEIKDKALVFVLSDWVQVDATNQDKSLSVMKNNEFTNSGDTSNRLLNMDSRERSVLEIKM